MWPTPRGLRGRPFSYAVARLRRPNSRRSRTLGSRIDATSAKPLPPGTAANALFTVGSAGSCEEVQPELQEPSGRGEAPT